MKTYMFARIAAATILNISTPCISVRAADGKAMTTQTNARAAGMMMLKL